MKNLLVKMLFIPLAILLLLTQNTYAQVISDRSIDVTYSVSSELESENNYTLSYSLNPNTSPFISLDMFRMPAAHWENGFFTTQNKYPSTVTIPLGYWTPTPYFTLRLTRQDGYYTQQSLPLENLTVSIKISRAGLIDFSYRSYPPF